MSGAELFGLVRKAGDGVGTDRSADPISLVSDNDDHMIAGDRGGSVNDIQDHRPPEHLVEHLGPAGFHSFAQNGCQNDRGHIVMPGNGFHLGFSFTEPIAGSFAPW
jgi:hypothetical protein